jgi:hypothetical protein
MNADAAFVELAQAKKAVRASRRAFAASPASGFVKAMRSAIQQYLDAIGQGVTREDASKGLELELREAWPKSVSKFKPACDSCDDTGYIDRVCWDRHRCSREVCQRNPERQHAYVEVCHCPKGDAKRPKQFTPDDAISGAGRTAKKKPRGFTRFGS